MVESQQKAFADFLEQQRSIKSLTSWEAQRKAISEQIEHAGGKRSRTWWNGSGPPERRLSRTRSMQSLESRPKPDEPKPDEPKPDE